jgi:cell division protease FtsH
MTKDELLGKVDVLLRRSRRGRGRVREISTGAHNDLQRATDIVRSIVVEYGMGHTSARSPTPAAGRRFSATMRQTPPTARFISMIRPPPRSTPR